MKFNKTAKRTLAMLIITVICFSLFFVGASAVSLDKTGSISLSVFDNDSKEPVKDAVFRVYLFASADTDGERISFSYTEEFKNNGMDMGDFSDSYLPVHLMAYANKNELEFTEKATDSNGKVLFDLLACGAYLVVPVGTEGGYLKPSPFIVSIPMTDESQSKLIYDIDATPKIESDKSETDEKTYISVKKQWQSTEKTPESITVSLIKDGITADTVTLSNENNWYYRWDDLSKKHSWNVIEIDVPEGYKVSYVTSQMSVVITNTSDDYEEETYYPEYPTSSPPEIPEQTTTTDELIDTGQLNWPVPVFSIAGLILFSIGWAIVNFSKKDGETV